MPEEERYICEGTHKAIIDEKTFKRVQEILQKNNSFKMGTVHDYLFKGLLYCADCGAKLYLTYSEYALKKYGEYRYTTICYTYSRLYNQCTRHSNSIPILEKVLIENIKKICSQYINQDLKKELINIAKKEKNNSSIDYDARIQELNKKIEDTSSYIKNLYMDKVRGIIGEKDFIDLQKSFENERQNYIKQKQEIIKISGETKIEEGNQEEIKKLAEEFISLNKPTKELLQRLIEKITISEESEITIYFKFKELNDISRLEDNQMNCIKTVNKRNKKAS